MLALSSPALPKIQLACPPLVLLPTSLHHMRTGESGECGSGEHMDKTLSVLWVMHPDAFLRTNNQSFIFLNFSLLSGWLQRVCLNSDTHPEGCPPALCGHSHTCPARRCCRRGSRRRPPLPRRWHRRTLPPSSLQGHKPWWESVLGLASLLLCHSQDG